VELAVAPDGSTFLSASYDRTIKLWNIASRSLVESVEMHEDYWSRMVVTPDGRNMVSAGDSNGIKIWSFPQLKVLARLSGM
jgi:WD40 repeat protein